MNGRPPDTTEIEEQISLAGEDIAREARALSQDDKDRELARHLLARYSLWWAAVVTVLLSTVAVYVGLVGAGAWNLSDAVLVGYIGTMGATTTLVTILLDPFRRWPF